MKVTQLGRPEGASYQMRMGHDPSLDVDILVRRYDDGHETYSTRPGRGDTTATWSPEIALTPLAPPSPYCQCGMAGCSDRGSIA